jgi:hypothetical protein
VVGHESGCKELVVKEATFVGCGCKGERRYLSETATAWLSLLFPHRCLRTCHDLAVRGALPANAPLLLHHLSVAIIVALHITGPPSTYLRVAGGSSVCLFALSAPVNGLSAGPTPRQADSSPSSSPESSSSSLVISHPSWSVHSIDSRERPDCVSLCSRRSWCCPRSAAADSCRRRHQSAQK